VCFFFSGGVGSFVVRVCFFEYFIFMCFSVFGTVGEVLLLYDCVHDEVFIDGSGLVLMANGRWLFSDEELEGIFSYLSLGVLV
jgi:hypothetical protein